MRLYIYAAFAALLLGAGVWIYLQGRQSGELDRARDTITTREKADEALADCAGRHWTQRLLNDCD